MIVDWASGVNTKILRSGTSWAEVPKYIEDVSRSGKVKRRMYHSQEKKPFAVTMRFTIEEYEDFTEWYNITDMAGLYDFNFPQIDEEGHVTSKVYRFATAPQYSNPNGDMIECSMGWYEV